MTAKQLGVKVLSKIQNLISEIDRSVHLTSTRKGINRVDLEEVKEEFDRDKVYSKMSYDYRKRNMQNDKILKDQIYEEQRQHQKFKITNKKTLKILNNKSIKPIHERAKDIITQRNLFIKYRQMNLQEQQKQSMRPVHRSTDDLINRKYNESDLESFREDIDAKNKERIKRRNMNKLPLVKKQQIKIPSVNQISRTLSSKRNLKKNYSDNVFKRMIQYNYDQQSKKFLMMEARRKEEGNFEPVLCSKSIEIAEKLKKSTSIVQNSNHHHSHCQLQHLTNTKSSPKRLRTKEIDKSRQKQKEKEKSSSKSPKKSTNKSLNKLHDKSLHKHKITTPFKQKSLNTITRPTNKKNQKLKTQNSTDHKKENRNTSKTKIKQPKQLQKKTNN